MYDVYLITYVYAYKAILHCVFMYFIVGGMVIIKMLYRDNYTCCLNEDMSIDKMCQESRTQAVSHKTKWIHASGICKRQYILLFLYYTYYSKLLYIREFS